MNKKETPRLLLEQETGQGKNNLSTSDYNMSKEKKQTVFDLLPRGEENALPSRDLAKLVGCKSVRDLQSLIADERDAGNLILSTCRHGGGYFRPADGEQGKREIAKFIATLQARALHTLAAVKTARKALDGVAGQFAFNDVEGV